MVLGKTNRRIRLCSNFVVGIPEFWAVDSQLIYVGLHLNTETGIYAQF